MKSNITSGTIIRTIILGLALLNQCFSMAGIPILPIEDAQIESLVSTGWTIVAAIIAWWKNNSFTKAAILADTTLKTRKGE